MPRFSNPSPPVFLAGLLLLAVPAAAQGPMVPPASPAPMIPPASPVPMAPAPAPPAPAPASVVDAQSQALFKQAITAQQALTALTATIAASTTGTGNSTSQTLTLAYEKPNQARIAVADSTGPIVQFVSDGKTLTVYAIKDKKYRTDPVPPGANVVPAVLVQARALLPRLIGQPEALGDLLTQPGVTASLGAPSTVGGVLADTVNATLPAPDGSTLHFVFAFGKTDHLLRQIIQSAAITKAGKTQTFVHTETVTTLQTTPTLTAADFSFTPPAGVTKIAATPPAAPPAAPPTAPAAPTPPSGQGAAPAAPSAEPTMYDPRLVPGAKPLTLATKDLNGHPIALSQYKGRVVLLDFWATWCGPCVGEMPNVIAAFKKYHGQGFDVIGVSLDESRPALTKFIAANKMPWRQVFDGKGWDSAVPHEFGVQSIPFGLLIGRDGQIAAVGVRGPELTVAIQKALAK